MDINEVLPKVLPFGWNEFDVSMLPMPGKARGFVYRDGLKVLATVEQYPDKSWWLHVSFSYHNKLPNWTDLRAVKDLFIGKKKLAVQILPCEDDYLNFHPNTLHLYTRVDGDTLPSLAPNDRTLT